VLKLLKEITMIAKYGNLPDDNLKTRNLLSNRRIIRWSRDQDTLNQERRNMW